MVAEEATVEKTAMAAEEAVIALHFPQLQIRIIVTINILNSSAFPAKTAMYWKVFQHHVIYYCVTFECKRPLRGLF